MDIESDSYTASSPESPKNDTNAHWPRWVWIVAVAGVLLLIGGILLFRAKPCGMTGDPKELLAPTAATDTFTESALDGAENEGRVPVSPAPAPSDPTAEPVSDSAVSTPWSSPDPTPRVSIESAHRTLSTPTTPIEEEFPDTMVSDPALDSSPEASPIGPDTNSELNCPGLHGLKLFLTPRAGFCCDVCGKKQLPKDLPMYGCRMCNWDACSECRQTKQDPTVDPAVLDLPTVATVTTDSDPAGAVQQASDTISDLVVDPAVQPDPPAITTPDSSEPQPSPVSTPTGEGQIAFTGNDMKSVQKIWNYVLDKLKGKSPSYTSKGEIILRRAKHWIKTIPNLDKLRSYEPKGLDLTGVVKSFEKSSEIPNKLAEHIIQIFAEDQCMDIPDLTSLNLYKKDKRDDLCDFLLDAEDDPKSLTQDDVLEMFCILHALEQTNDNKVVTKLAKQRS